VRAAALGGVIGPGAFIAAWAVGASAAGSGYSPVDDAISRLAAVGADTRPLMNAGFVAFGIGLPLYGWALRHVVGGAAWLTAGATGLATLGVAATPLDRSATVDTWHGACATLGYVTLTATPLLAAGPLRRRGRRALATAGVAAGAVSGLSLALTATDLASGLFQRLGLTVSDLWIAASAVAIVRGTLGPAAPVSPAAPGATPAPAHRVRPTPP
jgi:hypothetical membrane protein